MFVHESQHAEALEIAKRRCCGTSSPATPRSPDTAMGPVANESQYDKIQSVDSERVSMRAPSWSAAGPANPKGFETGYYVKPTIFGHVTERHDHCA